MAATFLLTGLDAAPLQAQNASAGAAEKTAGSTAKKNDEANFKPLFDGRTLAGWQGVKESYEIVDGTLICKKGASGNLFTEKEFADFALRFEFRLTPGANNGIGIRAPLEGDAAYVGMEIQILDNTAEKYAELRPYQFHGSIYGVAPAKKGHLKPVGEWNSQEIRCVGRQVTVTLNGEKIADVNLDEVASEGTVDGNEHPGLRRKDGHVGFLSHGDEVHFRNVRIQELPQR